MSSTNRGGLERHEHDFYETTTDAIDVVLDALGIDASFDGYAIDPGTGTGAIANRIAQRAPKADVRGIEKQADLLATAKQKRSASVAWEQGDWLTWQPDGVPDLILGNPPYQETRYDPEKIPSKKWLKDRDKQVYRSGGYEIVDHPDGFSVARLIDKDVRELVGIYPSLKESKHAACADDPKRGGLVIVDENLAEKFIRKALAVAAKKATVGLLLRSSYLVPKARRALREEFGKPDKFELEKRPSFNGSGTDSTDYAWFVWGPKRGGRWSVLLPPK